LDESTNHLTDLRARTRDRELSGASLCSDPMDELAAWYEDAVRAEVRDPNAMSVSTVSPEGQPSSRIVLMKYLDTEGPVFFTNYESRKARELAENPRVSVLFFWPELERQIQIRGTARRITSAESLRYFLRRPRESQVGAWVSAQSSVISARSVLESKFEEMKQKFAGGDVPLPSFWGGFRVRPEQVEVWQGRKHRLHDRFLYTREADGWATARLAP